MKKWKKWKSSENFSRVKKTGIITYEEMKLNEEWIAKVSVKNEFNKKKNSREKSRDKRELNYKN